MKKTVFQITVLSLFLIMGCSKDEMTTDEQELFSLEKNKQPVIGEKRGLDNQGYRDIYFQLTSINGDAYAVNCMPTNRKILKTGYFEGNIQGFGVINPNLSYFEFSEHCKEFTIERGTPTWGETYKYELEIIGGKVATSSKDYFFIDIMGCLYPWFNYGTQTDVASLIATTTTYGGQGKFRDFNNQNFMVGNYGSEGTNLEKGVIHWWMH